MLHNGKGELKSFQSELTKTASAGDSLLDTLKNIGVTVGFSALLKETFKLKADFEALDNRMKDLFGKSNININIRGLDGVKVLTSQFNLSNTAAKQLLVTIGSFGKSLKQNNQYIGEMSLNLSKAAADYAAYTGASTSKEIVEIGKKFGKATLGETGELKDLRNLY